MTDRLTCCPHCGTTFRTTEQQLQTARGAVRCGSCLKIFNALEHLIESQTTDEIKLDELDLTAIEERLDSSSQSVTDSGLTGDQDEDLAGNEASLDELMFDQDINLNQLDEELDEDFEHLLGEEGADNETASASEPEPEPEPLTEPEAKTEALESRFEDTLIEKIGEINAAFQIRGQFGEYPGALFDRQLKVVESHTQQFNSDETWAINLLEEFAVPGENANVGQFYSDPEPADATDPDLSYVNLTAIRTVLSNPALPNDGEADLPDDEDYHGDIDLSTTLPAARQTPEAAEPSPFELLQQIAPASVDFEKPVKKNRQRRLAWSGLCLAAMILLAGQIAWFERQSLLHNPQLRPIIQRACEFFGCALQPLRAPQLIRAANLVVRTHPDVDGALIIDSVLLNTAPYSQPFPDFTMVFTDLSGKLVAQRRFHPDEYLNGELAGIETMPSGQPVHISLEIVDPGDHAINYAAAIPLD